MSEHKPWEIYDVQMQQTINNEINQDGIYNRRVQAVLNEEYAKALELNQEIQKRISKIYSESEGDRKEQAGLRLELLAIIARDIQLKISKPNYN